MRLSSASTLVCPDEMASVVVLHISCIKKIKDHYVTFRIMKHANARVSMKDKKTFNDQQMLNVLNVRVYAMGCKK